MSLLSKRMTKKPRDASCSQNCSSQSSICEARPMISSIGDACAEPNVS
jgi:hypothetical protein